MYFVVMGAVTGRFGILTTPEDLLALRYILQWEVYGGLITQAWPKVVWAPASPTVPKHRICYLTKLVHEIGYCANGPGYG